MKVKEKKKKADAPMPSTTRTENGYTAVFSNLAICHSLTKSHMARVSLFEAV